MSDVMVNVKIDQQQKMFENLSSFVDRVNKSYDRKELNRLRERSKYLDSDDDEELCSPTQKSLIDMEERREKAIILSSDRSIINHILLFAMDFSIYDIEIENQFQSKKKKSKKKQHAIDEDLLNLILVNRLWYELVSAHHWIYENVKEDQVKSKKLNLPSSFFGKIPLTSLSSLLLKIPSRFHSISGVNQTKIVLELDTQQKMYISFYKIQYHIFQYLVENTSLMRNSKKMDKDLSEVIDRCTDRMKMIMLFNNFTPFQFFLKTLKEHYLENGFCVLFCHGGCFSCCYFEKLKKKNQSSSDANILQPSLHKSFHKYVTRKKQGKRQVSKDQSKRCKSVGSEIRRMQEEHLKLKSRKYLTMWGDVLGRRETIICIQTPGPYNEYTIFNRKKEAGSSQSTTNSFVANEDEETQAVKSKENKYEDFIDKKYICPFTRAQCFTIPAVKSINSSNPNHNSCIEAKEELLSVCLHDENGLSSLMQSSNTASVTSPTEEDEEEVFSNDEDDEEDEE